MQEKVIDNLNSLRELLENFYVKYNKSTIEIDSLKYIIEELQSLDFQNIIDANSANNVAIKLNEVTNVLNKILKKLKDILFEHYPDYQNYPKLKQYLVNREYYSKDDRDKAFREQLKHNDYDIYLINGLNLVNLFHREKIISFATKDKLDEYIEENKELGLEVIIKTKTDNFEEEYKNYYNYLLKHGYNYSINDECDPFTIASELVSVFEGQVLTEGFMFYSKNFKYPKDFNNAEYLEKFKEFLALNKNKKFVKDYREMQALKKEIQLNIDELSYLGKRYTSVLNKLKNNYSNNFSNEILFLDKCYAATEPRFGYGNYLHFDYYKALDMDSLRKSLNDNSLGTWKTTEGIKHSYDRDYKNCVYCRYFSWTTYEDIEKGNKKLEEELDSIKNSSIEEIEVLTQEKYIIESNSNLDYETLLNEYYSNFGMNSKEFVEMIQRKYACNVTCPKIESQSTKLVVRKAG